MKNFDLFHLLLIGILIFGYGCYLYFKIKQRIEIEAFQLVYPGLKDKIKLPPNWFLGIRYFLYFFVVILLSLSILNPSFSEEAGVDERTVSGVDIIFMVDVSLSMNAVDSLPNRLGRFKETVLRLLPSLNGNRMGIIAFAGVPFLYCPMTSDITAFSDYIRGLDVDMIPNTGTNLKKAFEKAEDTFKSGKVFRNKILVLVTDGEDIKGSTPSKLDVDMIIWGVGTESGGNIFYKNEQSGVSGFVTTKGNLINNQNDPELIRTKLDEDFLLELASIQKADYNNISANPAGADLLIGKIESMNKNSSTKLSNLYKKDGYQYFLFPAIFLLLLDLTLIEYLLKRKINQY